jgi:hypothetical protein
MPASIIVAPTALFRKQTAELSRGLYQRGATLDPANASQYNTRADGGGAQISMSILQAILAALSGHVEDWSASAGMERGTVVLASTTRMSSSLFSWDVRNLESPSYGGFVNGLTYQVVEIHLLWCLLIECAETNAQSREVAARWEALLSEMRRFAAPVTTSACVWSTQQVADACRNSRVQAHLERVADALWFSLRYVLPGKRLDRTFTLTPEPDGLPSQPGGAEGFGLSPQLMVPPRQVAPQRPPRPIRLSQPGVEDISRPDVLDKVREERLEQAQVNWQLPDAETWFW